MAGQPPEPSFQPSGQEPGATQARPAWQPTAYPPPPSSGQPGYSQEPSYSPPEPSYSAPESSYTPPPDQSYGGGDRTFTSVGLGNAQAQEHPGYSGYQGPSYGAQPGQGTGSGAPPQWQGMATAQAPQPKPRGDRGFVGSLLDFSFSSFVTPKIIKVLYALVTIWVALVAVIVAIIGFETGGWGGGLAVLIIVDPIVVLLMLGLYRVILEAFMVVFRIYEEAKQIRENTTPKD
jgi:hypothetical protein